MTNSKFPKWLRPLLFVTGGALLGFAYYYFIGCQSGTCPITSNPLMSTAYGAFIGVLLSWNQKAPQQDNITKKCN